MVRDENLRFMKNRDVYNPDYFNFTLSLASVNAVSLYHPFEIKTLQLKWPSSQSIVNCEFCIANGYTGKDYLF